MYLLGPKIPAFFSHYIVHNFASMTVKMALNFSASGISKRSNKSLKFNLEIPC